MSDSPLMDGPLLIVGGYGLVGERAARELRRRHPCLKIELAGRRPERARRLACQIGASTAEVDVSSPRPLTSLAEPPAAVLAAVSDPDDLLLLDAMRSGIPIADINRAGHANVLDAAVLAAREQPVAPVLMAGSWLSGLTALAAAAVAREVERPDRIDIVVLADSADRVGPDAWGFTKRLAWPYHAMRAGVRRPVHPLTGVRRMPCADGRERYAALVGTLGQISLPLTLSVPTVETRIALFEPAALWGLVALKRSGALRALGGKTLSRVRKALLERSGTGGFSGFTVTATAGSRSASVEALDHRGQAHLNGVGAAAAAERVLGHAGIALSPGVSFPEQWAQPQSDLAALRDAGVVVRTEGFRSTRSSVTGPARDWAGVARMPRAQAREQIRA